MKALTLWRPWSDAIVRGPKRIENRTWAPPAAIMGRFIAIHAGRKFDDGGGCDLMAMGSGWTGPLEPKDSPEGIVGIARIIGALATGRDAARGIPGEVTGYFPTTNPPDELLARIRRMVDDRWWIGPVGWLLDDVLAIEPVPCRGAQGLWTVPADVEALVRARVEEARCS